MSKLNSKAFHLIIEKFDKLNNREVTFTKLLECLEDMTAIEEYSFILHGEDKTRPHYHINLLLASPHQADSVLFSIASDLMINVNCIGIKSINLEALYRYQRYLIHKDNSDKFQYESDEVMTNNHVNYERCLLGINPYVLSVEYITYLCKSRDSIIEVYSILGLKNSTTYRHVIRDIWNSVVRES